MMKKLVPASKSQLRKLGLVQTTNGLMFDKSKLTDKKKYQPKEKAPENPVIKKKPEVRAKEKADKTDETKGLY